MSHGASDFPYHRAFSGYSLEMSMARWSPSSFGGAQNSTRAALLIDVDRVAREF